MHNKKEEKRSSSHSSFFPKNQKGQGLSTNAIILIVLGVIILVILIAGFTMGWSTIAPWLPSDNVDSIANQCETACLTNSEYDYCRKARILKEGKIKIETSCAVFSVISEYSKYGIDECPSIDCNIGCTSVKINEDRVGQAQESCEATEDDISSITDVKCCIIK
ncbi:hypothetical protein KAJ87_02555 [Candidatus Pacearchaeota archaeon]|nr:hypothetical protein [Candidatus Pacearchaeota archaeon]